MRRLLWNLLGFLALGGTFPRSLHGQNAQCVTRTPTDSVITSCAVAPRTITITIHDTVPPVVPPPDTVITPPVTAGADPTKLPAATTQVKNLATYTALKVAAMAAGGSYRDPVTGVRVWKVSSATVPVANTGAGHDYSEGPVQVSREWGTASHTLLVRVDGSPYYLVDLRRGAGISNWRKLTVAPASQQAATFAQSPATPQIMYIATGSQIVRYDAATGKAAPAGRFPLACPIVAWMTQDRYDRIFVGMTRTSGEVVACNAETGAIQRRTFTNLDEPYFARDGRYVVANTAGRTTQVWDLQTNTVRTQTIPGNATMGHNPALRGSIIAFDVGTGAGQIPTWRIDLATGQTVQIATLGGYAPDGHSAGQWAPDGDPLLQYFLRTSFDWSYKAYGGGAKEALAFIRADGKEFRLLAHHYSVKGGTTDQQYWSEPRATISPDGKIVLFDSNMAQGGRPDLFAVEVPTP